jgi:Trk K+ transport system NAD-binding subunit
VRVAADDTILAEGDEINAIVAPDAMTEFAQMFQVEKMPIPAASAGA